MLILLRWEISDADFVAEVTKNTGFVGDDNSDNEDDDSTVGVPPTSSEAANAVQVIGSYLLSQEVAMDSLSLVDKLDDIVDVCRTKNLKQSLISEYFAQVYTW